MRKFGRRVDDLSSAASYPSKKTGLTMAAHALDKHALDSGFLVRFHLSQAVLLLGIGKPGKLLITYSIFYAQ